MDNEQIIRKAYQIAEDKNSEGWLAAFTEDGTFTDESIGVTYRGRDRTIPLENYARAFPDMHRELYQVYVTGDIVVVQLALQGTHNGPLSVATEHSNRPGSGWTRRAATCSSWKTARSNASTAAPRQAGFTRLGPAGYR